jgi:hypothetical protein
VCAILTTYNNIIIGWVEIMTRDELPVPFKNREIPENVNRCVSGVQRLPSLACLFPPPKIQKTLLKIKKQWLLSDNLIRTIQN